MPIRRLLEGRNFEPKAAAMLVEAFDGVVADLDLRTPAEKEQAAKIVIGLATCQTAVDPEKLRDDAASVMRDELIGAKRT